jgi:hypothetical protein
MTFATTLAAMTSAVTTGLAVATTAREAMAFNTTPAPAAAVAAIASLTTDFSCATTTITAAPTNATTPIPEGTSPLPLHRRPPTQAVLR